MHFGIYSCAPVLVEAWPELHDRFVNEKYKRVPTILLLHFLKYKHRAFRLGKFKHFIAQIALRKGAMELNGRRDLLLDLFITLYKLK